jgi:arylsulfatase
MKNSKRGLAGSCTAALVGVLPIGGPAWGADKTNIVMPMTDDTGWNDFGAYSGGGAGLGHPTPNIDRIAKEGATFTSWYGQASCTAGRASFITGRIPIRSPLSIVVAPGDENRLRKETPTMPNSSRKMATRRISRVSGISATSPMPIPSNTASTR